MNKQGGWNIVIKEYELAIEVCLNLKVSLCDSSTSKKVNLTQLGNKIEQQLKNTYGITYFKNV